MEARQMASMPVRVPLSRKPITGICCARCERSRSSPAYERYELASFHPRAG